MFKKKFYSVRKCKKILKEALKLYQKKKKKLSEKNKLEIENILKSLTSFIHKKDKKNSNLYSKKIEQLFQTILKKNFFEKIRDSFLTLVVAIFIAILIRQMVFENYTIPSGSMRPTFKEKDFLIVSKTSFGINTFTRKGHFYFNPNLVKRGDIAVFTTLDMDIEDSNHMYFFIIPGKKQFIKRIIAKPEDTIYFYGGQIYGIDKEGNEIEDFKNIWFKKITHIPFIQFKGKENLKGNFATVENVTISQMNTPVAELILSSIQNYGKLLTNNKIPFSKDFQAKDFFEIWGFENYSMTRILSKNKAQEFYGKNSLKQASNYYLEIMHHPTIKKVRLEQDQFGRIRPSLSYSFSIIPLNEHHLKALLKNMCTCRFQVKNKKATRVGMKYQRESFMPDMNIEDGCYEFQNGKAYKVNFLGITKKLNEDHPIYHLSNKDIQTLYNLGIEMNTLFSPKTKHQNLRPSRYGFFRGNSLFLLNSLIYEKTDPAILEFIKNEKELSKKDPNYHPFIDKNPSTKINKETILKYGLKIPKNHYLALGDNYAMSADSREFGFVPQKNLRGRPLFIFWPPQSRFGKIFQPPHPFLTFPFLTIWIAILLIITISIIILKKRKKIDS